MTVLLAPTLAQLNYAKLMIDGGFTNVFIAAMSVVAFATVIERLINLRRGHLVSESLIATIRSQWENQPPATFERYCTENGSVFARAAAFLSRNRTGNYSAVSTAVSDIASIEIRRHQQRIYPLMLIASIAPLAGLFGTVIGIVETFNGVAETGQAGNVSVLAGGIYKALSCTAAGLFVAIPALAFYHYFRMRLKSASILLEEGLNGLLNDYLLRS